MSSHRPLNPKRSHPSAQSGFILMLFVVILVVGAAAYFGSFAKNYRFNHAFSIVNQQNLLLNSIKAKLLNYGLLFPEYYSTSSDNSAMTQIAKLGGPGYLPCPWDEANNRVMTDCKPVAIAGVASPKFIQGFLPPRISTRHLYFGDISTTDVILILDERFAYNNSNYNAATTQRFAPLNTLVTPALKLNDDGLNYVALLVLPGVAQTGQAAQRPAANPQSNLSGYLDRRYSDIGQTIQVNGNVDGDDRFYSAKKGNYGVNDVIVGITQKEWADAMTKRVCSGKAALLASNPLAQFWFNTYHAINNPTGSSWRGLVLGGMCP